MNTKSAKKRHKKKKSVLFTLPVFFSKKVDKKNRTKKEIQNIIDPYINTIFNILTIPILTGT